MKKIMLLVLLILGMDIGGFAQTRLGLSVSLSRNYGNLNTKEAFSSIVYARELGCVVTLAAKFGVGRACSFYEYSPGYSTRTVSKSVNPGLYMDLNINPLLNQKATNPQRVCLRFGFSYQILKLTYISDNTEYIEKIGETYRKTTPFIEGGLLYRLDGKKLSISTGITYVIKTDPVDRDPAAFLADKNNGTSGASVFVAVEVRIDKRKNQKNQKKQNKPKKRKKSKKRKKK